MNVKLLAAAVAVLVSTAAQAVAPGTLGPANSGFRYQLSLGDGLPFSYSDFGSGSGPGAINRLGTDPGSGSSGLINANISYGSNPTLSSFVQASGSGLSSISLTMNYAFAVTATDQAAYDALAAYLALDPANGLTVTGNYAVNVSGAGSSDAGGTATIDAGFGQVVFRCTPGGGDCGNSAVAYSTTGAVTGDPGTLRFNGTFLLGTTAFAAVGMGVGNNQSAYAMIDPVVSLPQGFMGNPGDYLVAYSANLNSATPEPASWAMLITGFGLVGAVRRRQRAQVA